MMTNFESKRDYPDFPRDYVPETVFIYDHIGHLVTIKQNQIIEESMRPAGFEPQLISWFFDGIKPVNIAYAHTERIVLINRIDGMVAMRNLNKLLEVG